MLVLMEESKGEVVAEGKRRQVMSELIVHAKIRYLKSREQPTGA